MKETELIGCFDARVWASEFCKRFPNNDEGTMLGWFANAIMSGYDKGVKDAPGNAQQQVQADSPKAITSEHPNASMLFDL